MTVRRMALLGVAAVAAVLLAIELPELRRYIKMETM
jgi:uncharacterized protein DUF6893